MGVLCGMKAISNHMNRSEATILKLILQEGLPVIKLAGTWETTTEKIDEWRNKKIDEALAAQAGFESTR